MSSASTCSAWNPLWVGDDFLFAGEEESVDGVTDRLTGEMILKKRSKLWVAEKDEQHCTVLNRPIDFTVDEDGPVVSCEPGPRHVELWLEHMELDGAEVKGVSTPGGKSTTYHDETELGTSTVTLYRSCVMQPAYCATYCLYL